MSTSSSKAPYSRFKNRTRSAGVVVLARSVNPTMSANRTETSSYLSAMTLRDELLRRSAMLPGNMLASSASERSYSASITASARWVSRSANHTATNTITQAETMVTTKVIDCAHAGCNPVSRGTRNSRAITSPAPTAVRPAASTVCSMPSNSTTRHAPTKKKNCAPVPVPASQVLTKTVT